MQKLCRNCKVAKPEGVKCNVIAITEAVVQRYSVKKVFLEISQNSQENTCARVSFSIKLQASAKFLRTPFLRNTSGRLLLYLELSQTS